MSAKEYVLLVCFLGHLDVRSELGLPHSVNMTVGA